MEGLASFRARKAFCQRDVERHAATLMKRLWVLPQVLHQKTGRLVIRYSALGQTHDPLRFGGANRERHSVEKPGNVRAAVQGTQTFLLRQLRAVGLLHGSATCLKEECAVLSLGDGVADECRGGKEENQGGQRTHVSFSHDAQRRGNRRCAALSRSVRVDRRVRGRDVCSH